MGTTWGDLTTWDSLVTWWNTAESATAALSETATLTATAQRTAFVGTTLHAAAETFCAADRIANTFSGSVIEGTLTATAAVVTPVDTDSELTGTASLSAAAVRVPPADRPAGALIGRIASRT